MIEIAGKALLLVTNTLMLLLLGRIVLSWFRGSFYRYPFLFNVFRFCRTLTEFLVAPLRRILPPQRAGAGFLDLAPVILWVLLILAQSLIKSTFF